MTQEAHAPYQVSVKTQKSDPAPFAWVIHQGDEAAPVAKSSIAYKSVAAARDAGRRALTGLKAKLSASNEA
jgi:hypothetical protein